MRRFGFCLLLLWLDSVAPARAGQCIVLSDFTLIDGSGAPVREVERLTACDGRITGLGGAEATPLPDPGVNGFTTRLDLAGAYVMPGLIDSHVHVARFPESARTAAILANAVKGGVTGIRDMGGDARLLAAAERAIETENALGPSMVWSGLYGGPAVFESGPISQMGFGRSAGNLPWLQAVEPEMSWNASLARTSGTGASGIKLYGNMDAAQVGQLTAEARRQGLMSWAHATVFPAGPADLVAAGVNSLSHAPYLVWAGAPGIPDDFGARTSGPWQEVPPDDPVLMQLYRDMAARQVLLDSTLFVYHQMQNFSPEIQAGWAQEAFEWGARATALAHRAGVRVTAGTDWFEPEQDGMLPHTHDELALLVEYAGLTPMEAIVAGTRNGAAALGMSEQLGTIAVGKNADMLVLEASPLEDIHNTRKLRWVIRHGRLIRPNG